MYKLFATILLLTISLLSIAGDPSATGIVKGIVIDSQSEQTTPVPFANVFLLGTSIGGSTDFDGNFEFSASPGEYKLIVSSIGYKNDTVTVTVASGSVIEKKIALSTDAAMLDVVEITAKADRESETLLLMEQKNSATITQAIGATELSSNGASDVEQGLTKVSGISKSEANSDLFVRGLGDRYNVATLNGLPIPSTNPDKKVIDMSILPTSVVQNIEINKTFTPNNTADFAGASINISTKDYYDRAFAQVGFSISANSITTGREFQRTQSDGNNPFLINADNRTLPEELETTGKPSYYSSPADSDEPIFKRGFNPRIVRAAPNIGISGLGGNSYSVGKNGSIGFLVSAEASNSYQYREGFARNTDSSGVDKNYFATQSYTYGTKQTGLANIHYSINRRNSVQVNGLYTTNTSDEISNYDSQILDRDRNTYTYSTRNRLTINTLKTLQLSGKHTLVNENFSVNWAMSHNKASNSEPDRTQLLYEASNSDKDDYRLEALNASDNHRFFSSLIEEELNARIDFQMKFNTDEETGKSKGILAVGAQPRMKSRTFEWRQFNMDMRQYADSLQNNDIVVDRTNPDEFLGNESYRDGLFSYEEARDGSRVHKAQQNIFAAYVMLDYAITKRLTVVAGARVEQTQQSIEYKQLRNLLSDPFQTKDYDTLNVLPSLSLRYQLTEKSNLRFAASQTVSRPNFRELAPFQYQDQSRRLYEGNVDLVNGYSYNADLKYEVFPHMGDVFAVSLFGKYIDNPIERYEVPSSTVLFTYFNLGRAIVGGVETEVKTTVGRFFGDSDDFESLRVIDRTSIGLNLAYNYTQLYVGTEDPINTSKGTILATNKRRQMQGASPYIVSANVGYEFTIGAIKSQWALVYNVFGPRVYLAGTYGRGDVIEKPVNTVDLILRNTVSERIDINFSVKNLLNPKVTQEQVNAGQTIVFDEYRLGTTAGLSINYRFFKSEE